MAGDTFCVEPGASGGGGGGGGGGGAVEAQRFTSPPISFSQELYLGPGDGYSYSSGGAGYLPPLPFATTISRVFFFCDALSADATIRLRTQGGTVLWSGTLPSGTPALDVTGLAVAVAAGTRVQVSIAPASGTPTLANALAGWVRSLS